VVKGDTGGSFRLPGSVTSLRVYGFAEGHAIHDLNETVDFNGPIGAPFSRRTMVSSTCADSKSGCKLSFAAEDPQDQFGGGSANERLPQLVARADPGFGWGALDARVLAHEKRSTAETKRGFGFGMGGSYKITDKDLLMGQYTRVDGDIDQLRGTLSYGMNRGKTAQAVDNRTLQQVFSNVIYSPIKSVEFGAEYIRGKRKTFTPETGTMSRFDLMGRDSF
jgi:hypothetical protein